MELGTLIRRLVQSSGETICETIGQGVVDQRNKEYRTLTEMDTFLVGQGFPNVSMGLRGKGESDRLLGPLIPVSGGTELWSLDHCSL